MFYTSEFDFDSQGNVVETDLTDEELFEQDMMDDPFDDCYEEDPFEQFFINQLQDYEDDLHDRIRNGEPIYSSEIGTYSDLYKDVWGVRPHMLMGWLTEYGNVIDDYAHLRKKVVA